MTTETKSLKTSKIACWLALACLVVPMFGSYFFDDMFSTVSQIFKNPEMLQLGWNSQQFGFYAGGYSFLCVWGGLIICGVLLDKFGVRIIGSAFVGLMVLGAAIVTWAISTPGLTPGKSLTIAYIGCTLFGLGSEIAGVAVTRSIAKWFKGKNVALAMGLQLAIARIGTGLAMLLAPVLVLKNHVEGTMYTLSETNKPAIVGLTLLFIGAILWAVFVAMDAKYDHQEGIRTQRGEVKEEDKFKFSDIWKVLSNPRFIMIALLLLRHQFQEIRHLDHYPALRPRRLPGFRDDLDDRFRPGAFHAAFRRAGRQGGQGHDLDDYRRRAGLLRTHDHLFCPRPSVLRLPVHRFPGHRLFAGPVCDVADRPEDHPREEPWYGLLDDLLDPEHGHDACPDLRGPNHDEIRRRRHRRRRPFRIHLHFAGCGRHHRRGVPLFQLETTSRAEDRPTFERICVNE